MKNPLKKTRKPKIVKSEEVVVEENPAVEEEVVVEETTSAYAITQAGDVWVVSHGGKNIYQNASEENAKRFVASKS